MLERVIENWLINSTEKTFQLPFCHMLQTTGYTVVHMSRHCGMELGKDIIAIDNDGVPCAFQLKTAKNGKIGLKQWKDELHGQMLQLVTLDINHPSIKSNKPHRSFLVTNGEFEEEVAEAIRSFNGYLEKQGITSKLEVYIKGSLFRMAIDLQQNLWPSELIEINTILEFYLKDGRENLPKELLTKLLGSIYLLDSSNDKKISQANIKRRCSSAALLTSLALNSYLSVNNYVAVIEGWTIYISYTLAFLEKLMKKSVVAQDEIRLAKEVIFNNLLSLEEEMSTRAHFIEGDYLVDQPFYKIRMTQILAYISLLGLWRKELRLNSEIDSDIKRVVSSKLNKIQIWGEVAIIQCLIIYWFQRKIDGSIAPDKMLYSLIDLICKSNKPRLKSIGLPHTYYSADDLLPYLLGLSHKPLNDHFIGSSYVLEGLIYVLTNRNLKQHMKNLWPEISRILFNSFDPEEKWQYYLWEVKRGTNKKISPKHRQSWSELREKASISDFNSIPNLIKEDFIFLLLFILVFPHRFNADVARFLHHRINKI